MGIADASYMSLRPEFRRRISRFVIALALAMLFAVPAASTTPLAGAKGNYRGQCRRLTKQINHFEGTILPLAIARGNRSWEAATNAQVERLWHRRADLCPAYGAERSMIAKALDEMRKFNQMLNTAGRAALAFFTGGLSGGIGP